MKRVLTLSAIMWCSVLSALAFLPPKHAGLPNFDKRTAAHPAQPELAAEKKAAVERLKQHVPGAKLRVNPVLRSPEFVADPHGFLTGLAGQGRGVSAEVLQSIPSNDEHRPIKAFLNEHSALFGYGAEVLNTPKIHKQYTTPHNGLKTTVWEQELDGLTIFESTLIGHVTKNGELVNITSRLVANPAAAANKGMPNRHARKNAPDVSLSKAILAAAKELGEGMGEADVFSEGDQAVGQKKMQRLNARKGLKGEILGELVWLPIDDSTLTLCWNLFLTSKSRNESFNMVVDATSGEVLIRRCLTMYISDASYRVYTSDSPSPFSPGLATPGNFQPQVMARTLVVTNAFSTNASPNGWIDDGVNETLGNNVDAHLDVNDDDQPDLPRPQGNNRVFDFPLDLAMDPTNSTSASVAQIFYLCNAYHDRLYDLGFTEAAGNFQKTNFNRGGWQNDAVQADALDGGGTDNAYFATWPDGLPGRMTIQLWTGPNPRRDAAYDAEIIYHELTHGLSWRLVGGGQAMYLEQSAALGEGWSDWYGLTLLSEAPDNINGNYGAGAYSSYMLGGLTENYYFGIRRYPYSTDMMKNPLTFKDIDPNQIDRHLGVPLSPIYPFYPFMANESHAAGEVWCVTLWEARANVIAKWGWAVGNQLILQLMTDAMKLCPPNPDFLQARDALLQADLVNSGGANFTEIWAAFAKRGMGSSATSPGNTTCIGVTEAFDMPGLAFKDAFSVDTFTGNGNGVIDFNECNEIMVVLVNNSRTTISNVNALIFTTNAGVSISQADSIYGDIPGGAVATNLIPFKIFASPAFACGSPLTFTLLMSSGLEVRTNTFQIATGLVGPAQRYNNSTPIAIPDANAAGVSSPISVSDFKSAVGKVTVSVHLTHTYDYDLTLELFAPDGTRVILSAQNGGAGDNYGAACAPDDRRTTFDDKATTSIRAGLPPFTGTFKPQQALTAFNGKRGQAVEGIWRLHATDRGIMASGMIQCWSLHLSPTICGDGGGDCSTDVAISSSYAPVVPIVGSNVTVTLTVTNFGPNTARNVTVTNYFPPGVTFVSANSTRGGCQPGLNHVVCTLGGIPNAGSATMNITVRPTFTGTLTNIAVVTSTVPDLDSSNNSATMLIPIYPPMPILVPGGTRLVTESGPVNRGIDPGEIVRINFGLQNIGALSTLNLVATLLESNGVTVSSGSANYGVVVPGGPVVAREFTFTAAGASGDTVLATFHLQDGTNDLGLVRFPFSLGGTYSYANQSVIIIRDNTNATPYPTPVYVSGLAGGVITKVTVQLLNVNHTRPEHIDALLVGPNGQKVMLMSDAGYVYGVNNVNLTFEDSGAALGTGPITSGTYRPTDLVGTSNDDAFLSPAPAGPYASSLSVLNGTDPNGTWNLFIMDDTKGDEGRISGGWSLNITMADYVDPNADLAVMASDLPDPVMVGNNLTYSIVVTNLGPDTATGIVVTNVLPNRSVFVSASSSQGACSNVGSRVICALGSLTNRGQASIAITTIPNLVASATNTLSISNFVRVAASELDPNLFNNSLAVLTSVTPLADVGVSIVATPSPATINETLTYTINVTNFGPNASANVRLVNVLPAGVTFISVSPAACKETNGVVSCDFGSAERATATLVVRPDRVGVVSNAVQVLSAQPADLNQSNNLASVLTTVNYPSWILSAAGAVLISESGPINGGIDPSELITVDLRIRNAGISNTTQLVGTLLAGGGVNTPSEPQTYGAIPAAGGVLARRFSFTAEATNGGTITASLQLRDGEIDLGVLTYNFIVGNSRISFDSSTPTTIPDLGPATVYPSQITITNMVGVINDISVTVSNLWHSYPADIDMLLVSPEGQSVLLMSDAGGNSSINGVTLRFDSATGSPSLPENTPIASGVYKPSNYGPSLDDFPAPAPEGPYKGSLSAFYGVRPNGAWSLYIVDDFLGDIGRLDGGWSINLTTVGRINYAPANLGAPTLTTSGQIQFQVTGAAGATCTIESSTDLRTWTPLGTQTLTGDAWNFVDLSESTGTQKFYRAVTE